MHDADDDTIRIVVKRLARPTKSGGSVIERAAILAEGSTSTEILAWIVAHDGQPETLAVAATQRGLHSSRLDARSSDPVPRRYVLPAGALA